MKYEEVKLEDIKMGEFKARDKKEELIKKLSRSMDKVGFTSAIVGYKDKDRKIVPITGYQRLYAAKLSDIETIPVLLIEATDKKDLEKEALGILVSENVHRKDFNHMEMAKVLKRWEEAGAKKKEISWQMGVSQSQISNLLSLNELHEDVQDALETGDISFGHAKVMFPLRDDTEKQLYVLNKIIEEGLSTRETEKLVRQLIGQETDEPLIGMMPLELPENVTIDDRGKTPKLTISFGSIEELVELLEELRESLTQLNQTTPEDDSNRDELESLL